MGKGKDLGKGVPVCGGPKRANSMSGKISLLPKPFPEKKKIISLRVKKTTRDIPPP